MSNHQAFQHYTMLGCKTVMLLLPFTGRQAKGEDTVFTKHGQWRKEFDDTFGRSQLDSDPEMTGLFRKKCPPAISPAPPPPSGPPRRGQNRVGGGFSNDAGQNWEATGTRTDFSQGNKASKSWFTLVDSNDRGFVYKLRCVAGVRWPLLDKPGSIHHKRHHCFKFMVGSKVLPTTVVPGRVRTCGLFGGREREGRIGCLG